MNRILLADDSPHAQRMGERILRDEGYEIVSVTDGETALLRMADVDPDLIVADVFLPVRSGLDIVRYVKSHPQHRHVRVVLTAGLLETFDEKEATDTGADAIIRKPFEASVVIDTITPLVSEAARARSSAEQHPGFVTPAPAPAEPAPAPKPEPEPIPVAATKPVAPAPPPSEPVPEPEPRAAGTAVSQEELLRAAVTLALDAAFPALVEEITANVLRNLQVTGNGGDPPDIEPKVVRGVL